MRRVGATTAAVARGEVGGFGGGSLGVTVGASLLYATGGVAFMGARSSVLDPGEQEAIRRTITGWTIGGGWEYAFASDGKVVRE